MLSREKKKRKRKKLKGSSPPLPGSYIAKPLKKVDFYK
jgi:hypothetical protein